MPGTPFEVSTRTGPIAGRESGQGPALLFLHGGPGLSDYGEMLSAEAADWRLIHYQQRGLSPSSVDGPFTIEQHIADAVAVLDARDGDRVVVAGHSWGVHLALQLALAHPERVPGLVLIDGPGVTGDGGVAKMGEVLIGRLLPGSLQRLREIAGRMAAGVPTDADATEQTVLLWPGYFAEPTAAPPAPPEMRVSVAAHAGAMTSMLDTWRRASPSHWAPSACPSSSSSAVQSPMAVSQGEQAAELIPSAQVRVIPAAGHLPWAEHPGCVADALASIRPDGQPGGSCGLRIRRACRQA